MLLLQALVSDANVNRAWHWLCQRRRHFPANDEVWHLRFVKDTALPKIMHSLRHRRFTFSPPRLIHKRDGTSIVLWSATDVLVQKMLAQILEPLLPVHRNCTHIKGHGGAKQSVNRLHHWIASGEYAFVCRTDIRGYYANINKHQLLEQLAAHIHCRFILNLLYQYLHYSVEYGGTFHTPAKGISRGSPLSPLMAGFQLVCIDQHFSSQKHLRYQRYMDDFIILCHTRWQLRRAVRDLNRFLTHFGFAQHPDKTFIGPVKKGFDWLGYQFNAAGLSSIAPRTLQHFTDTIHRLYEQARQRNLPQQASTQRVADYIRHWRRWAEAGLPCKLSVALDTEPFLLFSP